MITEPAYWSWVTPWPIGTRPARLTPHGIVAALYEWQAGCCAMCGRDYDSCRNGAVKIHPVDHDHGTESFGRPGGVRGLLCHSCNSMESFHNWGWHKDCNWCNLFVMYRTVSPMSVLGFEMDYATFMVYAASHRKGTIK